SIMLEASTGFYFGDDWTGPETRDADKDYHGTHGYLPSKLEMRSSLVVYGQGARPGARAAGARMVDIAPTAPAGTRLGLPDSQGQVLSGLIKPQYVPPPNPDRRRNRKKADSANRKPVQRGPIS